MKKVFFCLSLFLFSLYMNAEKIRIACIGDSITWGSGVEQREVNCYPVVLQGLVGEKFDVRNFGNPGRGVSKRSMRGSEKRGYIFMKEHKAAIDFNPQIVICNIGINDLTDWDRKIEDGRTFADEFQDEYIELINFYRDLPSKPYIFVWGPLAPLFPGQRFHGSPNVDFINNKIKSSVEWMNKNRNRIINGKKVIVRPLIMINMFTPLKDFPELFPDKIHPNAVGAKIIAEETYKVLKRNLRNLFK